MSLLSLDANVVWGFDCDGDFGCKVGENVAVFYKWHDAVIFTPEIRSDFTELTDEDSKILWRKGD